MPSVAAKATDVHEAIKVRIRGLLGNADEALTGRAIDHLEYLWSEGTKGFYHADVHSVVWTAVADIYTQQGLANLESVPRMLRAAALPAITYDPIRT